MPNISLKKGLSIYADCTKDYPQFLSYPKYLRNEIKRQYNALSLGDDWRCFVQILIRGESSSNYKLEFNPYDSHYLTLSDLERLGIHYLVANFAAFEKETPMANIVAYISYLKHPHKVQRTIQSFHCPYLYSLDKVPDDIIKEIRAYHKSISLGI